MRDSLLPHEARVECPGCGMANERGTQVCVICGSPLDAGSRSAGGTIVESCRIERWRGYVTSSFYAVSADGAVLFESSAIRARGAAPPAEKPKARAAYDKVVAALLAVGWEPSGQAGSEWYATRYTRVVEQDAVQRPALAVGLSPPAAPRYQPAVSPPARSTARPAAAEKSNAEEPMPGAPASEAAAGPPPVARRRRWARVLLGVVGTVAVAVAAVVLLVHRGAGTTPTAAHVDAPKSTGVVRAPDARPAVAESKAATSPTPARGRATAAPSRHVVELRVEAVSGASWVEIRRESAAGRVLYRATLLKGQHVRFTAPSVWATFGAASGLVITVDGRRYGAYGTVTHTFSARS